MTPQRLVLNEFGPYTEEKIIDFDDLGDHHLFLIHGPTGSGKSTLLDAICFALYGTTSGDERDGQEMRSDFANDDEPTEVTFDFRLGATPYRIRRRPKQTLAKKRGSGTTDRGAEATLYDRTEADDTADDGAPLADGVRDVDARVHTLLGLEAEQFRQVVMLPQGKFRAFLSSSSGDREEILKVLFETHRFEQLQDILKAMATEAQDAVDEIRQTKAALLEPYDADSLDALTDLRDDVKAQRDDVQERMQTTETKRDDAREALEEAKTAQDLLDERETARAEVEALRDKREAHEDRKARLKEAQRAAEVAPIADDLETRRDARKEANAALESAKEALQSAEAHKADAEAALDAEHERDDDRAALRAEATRLADLDNDVSALAAAREEASEQKRALETVTKKVEDLRETVQGLNEDLDDARERRKALSETAQMQARRETECEAAEALQKAAAEWTEKQSALNEANEAVHEAEHTLSARSDALQTAIERRDALEQERRDAYATVLADRLVDGEPCPVCGAVEHPNPAHADHDVPDEDTVEDARAAVKQYRSERDAAREALSEARERRTRVQADIDNLLETHSELEDHDADAIQARYEEAQAALDDARAAADAVDDLRKTIRSVEQTRDERTEEIETLQEEQTKTQRAVDRLSSKIDTLTDRVPDAIDGPDALQQRKADVADELSTLETALTDAETAHQEAREALVQAQESLRNAETNAKAAAQAEADAQTRFEKALQQHDFADADAFEAARMDADTRSTWEERVEAFEQKWTAALDRRDRADEAASDVEAPDVDAAQSAVESLEEAYQDQRDTYVRQGERLERLNDCCERLQDLNQKLQDADARYTEVGRLSDVASGTNRLNMSLQRFVLATRLEDVLRMANQHMQQMTQNRYRLRRAQGVDDRRRSAGLDLEVNDAYTGDARPVATLSGGEGFQAALALALGLSDVVQRIAGGRHLETIFIDEGFGSLDPESLDRALDALMQLQESGRLVGIISHVADLKQRVPARLEVLPSQEGSDLRIVA